MDSGLQHDRLEAVSTLSTTLADRILTERTAGRSLPLDRGHTLWVASLLLEEWDHPVPAIVADALARLRSGAPMDSGDHGVDGENVAPPEAPEVASGRAGVLSRLFRAMRPAGSAATSPH